MRGTSKLCQIALCWLFLSVTVAHGSAARIEWGAQNTLGGTLNPRGLQNTLDFSASLRLTRSAHPLLSRARVGGGLSQVLSPSYAGLSGWLELAPLSVLEMRAGLEHLLYFGAFGSLLPYDGYADNFDENARDDRWENAVSRGGRRLYVSPSVKFKAGRLSGWGNVEWEWWKVHSPRPFFYEPRRDTVLKRNDKTVRTTAAVLYGKVWQAGPIYQELRVPDAPGNRVRKLSALILWTLAKDWKGLREPVLILNLSAYLDDPYRTGEPFAALALRFGGTEERQHRIRRDNKI